MTEQSQGYNRGRDFLFIGGGQEQEDLARLFREKGQSVGIIRWQENTGASARTYIESWDTSLRSMYADIEVASEIMDPVRLAAIQKGVLGNSNPAKAVIYGQREKEISPETQELFESMVGDYVDWKRLMFQLLPGREIEWRKKLVLGHIAYMDTSMGRPDIYTRFVWTAVGNEMVKAIKESDQITKAEKENDQGWEQVQQGYPQESLVHFDRAISLSSRFYLPLINKGIALKNLGRMSEAVASYQQALTIDPNYKKAWHNRAVALATKGNIEEARVCVNKALEIDPDYEVALRFRNYLG